MPKIDFTKPFPTFNPQPRNYPFRNLTGKRFSNLLILGIAGWYRRVVHWYALCDCGQLVFVSTSTLRAASTKSCGCIRIPYRKHGMSQHPVYKVWAAMTQRCRDPKVKQYADYGGRGIKVCQRWLAFENFYTDMGARPTSRHTLERINNDGDYTPSNCKWETRQKQQRNRRVTRWLTVKGVRRAMSEWTQIRGFRHDTISSRLSYGWSVEDAVLLPVSYKHRHRSGLH